MPWSHFRFRFPASDPRSIDTCPSLPLDVAYAADTNHEIGIDWLFGSMSKITTDG